MDSPPPPPLPPAVRTSPPDSRGGQRLKKAFVPLGVLGVLLMKFKALLVPVLKFFPVLLKTGGTMFLTIWIYAQTWGWWYAVGFVLLIFVLDGGRIVTALSPWLWLVGLVVVGALLFTHFNFLLLLILLMSLPRLFFLFRRRTAEEARYFEVTAEQRWTMAALYFGLVAFLVLAMHLTHLKL